MEHRHVEVLLERPKSASAVPNHGVLRGKRFIPAMRGTFSAAVADSVEINKRGHSLQSQTPADIPQHVPRPLTALNGKAGGLCGCTPRALELAVRSEADEAAPASLWKFHFSTPLDRPLLAMHVFEHKDGAVFCNNLFGHHLLPNGKLAHFYLPPAAGKQGHKVKPAPPPCTPWLPGDWLVDGLPPVPAVDLLHPASAASQLPLLRQLTWVPVPYLAPAPVSCTLQGCRDAFDSHDVVLSSGFLAFAQHSGFLQAVEEAGIPVGGVMGTSAGALAGSLYAAGYTPREVANALSERPPIQLLKPSFEPWRGGVLSLDNVVARLRELLPPSFDGLQRDFAVGVVTADGEHVLIDQGPLPEAVAASAAIPFIFSGVDVPGVYRGLKDGGVVDRIGLAAWRQRRRQQQDLNGQRGRLPPCLVHIIERSSPFSGLDDPEAAGESDIQIVCCPKSGVNFFDLGAFDEQFDQARVRAQQHLEQYQAVLSALPQLSEQAQPQVVVSRNASVHGVLLPGSLGGVVAGPVGAGGRQELVLAVASIGGTASSSSPGSAPAPLAAPRQSSLSPSRSTVRRAVQDDSSS
eukprot:gene4535-4787_t